MTAAKLSRSQIARLGGFSISRKRGPDGMARLGSKGGQATLELRGRGHFVAAALKRWHPESVIKFSPATDADQAETLARISPRASVPMEEAPSAEQPPQ